MQIPGRGRSANDPDEELARQFAASNQLTGLIEAAAAPGSPAELAGESAALASFRDVTASHQQQPASRSARRRPVRLALAGGAAAAVLTGTGVAAASGALPGPLQGAAHDLFHAPPADQSGPSNGSPAATHSPAPTSAAPTSAAPTSPGTASGSVQASTTSAAPASSASLTGSASPSGSATGSGSTSPAASPSPTGSPSLTGSTGSATPSARGDGQSTEPGG